MIDLLLWLGVGALGGVAWNISGGYKHSFANILIGALTGPYIWFLIALGWFMPRFFDMIERSHNALYKDKDDDTDTH